MDDREITGAMIGLVASEGDGPDAPVHTRMWLVPPNLAGQFADEMTERFGQPGEGLSTMQTARDMANDGRTLFIPVPGSAEGDSDG